MLLHLTDKQGKRGGMDEVGRFPRILLPVDFSRHCDVAAHHAAWFARVGGGEIHIVHVIANPLDELYDTHDLPPLKIVDQAEAKAKELLAAMARNCIEPGIPYTLHVRHGDPFEKIVAVTEELRPQLIVLSTHGRGGLLQLVMGSVAEKVVRYAPCPIFVVPRQRKDTAETASKTR